MIPAFDSLDVFRIAVPGRRKIHHINPCRIPCPRHTLFSYGIWMMVKKDERAESKGEGRLRKLMKLMKA